jgi:hypothetical protein
LPPRFRSAEDRRREGEGLGEAAILYGDRPLVRRIVDYPLVAMLIAVALFFVTIVLAASVGQLLPPVPELSGEMKFELVAAILLLLLYKLVIRRMGQRPRDDLKLAGGARRLAIGLGTGLALFALIVGIAAALDVYKVTGEGDTSDLLAQLVLSALFPAISEEMLFRGILFRWIEEFGGSWLGLVLSSALFGAAHLWNPGASPIAVSFIAIEAGMMLGAAYMLTRSLWVPMGIHAAWNFTQGEIFDIPVSGIPVHGLLVARLNGPPLLTGDGFGLEASAIALVIATLFGLCLLWLAIRAGRLVHPGWVRRHLGEG